MIKAVLLDLDNTLITNPLNQIGQTTAGWNAFFNERVDVDNPGRGLLAAYRAMAVNTNPVVSNIDLFLETLASQWHISKEEASAHCQAFYREAYGQLQSVIQPRPAAPRLVHLLQEAGYLVVIATNPTFDANAIAQRLSWGDLPADLCEYALVTHIENTQFAKPNPHYYEEILGRLGVANEETLMVGDDWQNDMFPAEQAGLNTFWIREDGTPRGPEPASPDGEGTLSDLLHLTMQGWLETLIPRPLSPHMIVPRLLGNVGALFGLLREHTPEHWWQHPDPREWSSLEVICHLRDSEGPVQRSRLERIATEDNPFLSAPHDPPGPGEISCETVELCDPAESFAAERAITVAYLESLPPEAWQRPARHSIFGPTTLLEMANFTATHDRLHLQQICQTIGRCD